MFWSDRREVGGGEDRTGPSGNKSCLAASLLPDVLPAVAFVSRGGLRHLDQEKANPHGTPDGPRLREVWSHILQDPYPQQQLRLQDSESH